MTASRLCTTPNQHARPADLQLTASSATFRGYQDFVLTRHGLEVLPEDGTSLRRKHALLTPVLEPSLLTGRTVLDLGANSAFFSFLALQNGAVSGTAVDIDEAYARNVAGAASALGFPLKSAVRNVEDWCEPADVVIALALVHWLHNCSASFGSLGAVVGHLASLTRHALVVEWVDPTDPMIAFFGHLDWNPAVQPGPYQRDLFEQELAAHFARVEPIGDVSPTRRLYAAFTRPHPIDLRCPLPLRHDLETVVSCARLTAHAGVDYWSRVYDLGATIEKETTGGLAAREALVLQRLTTAAVPRVLDMSESEASSTVMLEKVGGERFDHGIRDVARSESRMHAFVAACLDLLVCLDDAQIVHRDIHKGNILIRDGAPVLIDFGWAIAPGLPIFTPEGFAWRVNSSDIHAMGRVLAEVCNPSWPVWRVVSLMAADDPRHRIEDPRRLRTLLEDVSDAGVEQLFLQIVQRDRTIAVLRRQLEAVQAGAAHAKRTLAESESALAAVERTLAHTVPPEALATLASYVGEPGDDASEVGSACSSAPDLLACVNALRQAARPRQALRLVRHLLTRVTESTDRETWLTALYAQASLYRELGRDADSLESFDRILAVDGTIASNIRGGALFHSARLLDARGATAAARERLEACLALIPNHAAARAALGTIGRANP